MAYLYKHLLCGCMGLFHSCDSRVRRSICVVHQALLYTVSSLAVFVLVRVIMNYGCMVPVYCLQPGNEVWLYWWQVCMCSVFSQRIVLIQSVCVCVRVCVCVCLYAGSSASATSVLPTQPITVQIQQTEQGTRLMIPTGQLSQLPGWLVIS